MPKRRCRFVFVLLLIFTLITFAYVRRETFFQQAKELIEQKLEQSLNCELAIEKIEPTLFYGLVLRGLEINFAQMSGLTFKIKVKEACVDYDLREILFSEHKEIQRLRLIEPEVNLSYVQHAGRRTLSPITESAIADLARLSSLPITRPTRATAEHFMVYVEDGRISFGQAQAKVQDLQGRLVLTEEEIYLQDFSARLQDNSRQALKIYGHLTKQGLSLTANFRHLKISDFDILSNLTLKINQRLDFQDNTSRTCGTIKSYGSVFNNHPFPELNSSFEIQGQKLRILTLTLGDNYSLRGVVGLTPPFNADLSLNLYQARPVEFFSQVDLIQQPNVAGLINGLIKITGAIKQPKIEGYLEAKEGHLGDLNFISAHVNLKGRYPKITIVDSRILREEDAFAVTGEIDLRNLSNQGIGDVELKPDKGMLWQGWDITRRRDNQVHMSKSVADDLKITFDAFLESQQQKLKDAYDNELGLEYKIFGNKALKLRLRKEEEILGVERRVKF